MVISSFRALLPTSRYVYVTNDQEKLLYLGYDVKLLD